jgi:hypothetical protein
MMDSANTMLNTHFGVGPGAQTVEVKGVIALLCLGRECLNDILIVWHDNGNGDLLSVNLNTNYAKEATNDEAIVDLQQCTVIVLTAIKVWVHSHKVGSLL